MLDIDLEFIRTQNRFRQLKYFCQFACGKPVFNVIGEPCLQTAIGIVALRAAAIYKPLVNARNLLLSLILMSVTGFGMMQEFAASSTVIQTIVEDDKRGRVMSYWTMAYMGASPFGSLLAGSLAPVIGAPGTVLLCGAGCILGAIWFWFQIPKLRPVIRPIYQKLGILPTIPAVPIAVDGEN